MARMSKEEYMERHRQYSRAYYERQKKKKIELGIIEPKQHLKRKLSVKTPSYIKVEKYTNGTILVEAVTRLFKTTPYDRYTEWRNPTSLYHRKIRLEKMVAAINGEKKLVVLDDYSVQVYLRTDNNLQEIIDTVDKFVKESIKMMHDLEN